MDALTLYTTTSAIWLSLQTLPLFIFPKLILDLLSPDLHIITQTETYFARLLAIALLTLIIISLYFTYNPPPPSYNAAPSSPNNPASSSTSAITHILTLYHTLTFIYIYTRYLHIKSVIPSNINYEANTTGCQSYPSSIHSSIHGSHALTRHLSCSAPTSFPRGTSCSKTILLLAFDMASFPRLSIPF